MPEQDSQAALLELEEQRRGIKTIKLKGFYFMDFDFKGTFDNLTQGKRVHRYKLVDGFLFKDGRACVGIGHFGVPKTLDLLNEQFFWPKMKHYVERICR